MRPPSAGYSQSQSNATLSSSGSGLLNNSGHDNSNQGNSSGFGYNNNVADVRSSSPYGNRSNSALGHRKQIIPSSVGAGTADGKAIWR